MCGITGTFRKKPEHDFTPCLEKSISTLAHRGPDDHGQELYVLPSGILGLGHTRLSIIDLTTAGHQPMHSHDERYIIIYNGEIYNYKELRQELKRKGCLFQTDSDTEVLLACWATWGQTCLQKLQGMYAFTVYDRENSTLTCIRDPFGIKPFYYHFDTKGFHFASEIPALLELLPEQPAMNLQRAYDYLVFGQYDNHKSSFFDGVYHLLPGHLLTIQLSGKIIHPEIHRWWKPSINERTNLSFKEATDTLRSMFLDSVRLHLRSDVALGAALSGGVDSSSVVCAMRYLENDLPIHTFSYVARGSCLDEEHWANIVNNHINAIPHKIVISPEELAIDLDNMIKAQGEPFGGTSIYAQYRVFKLAKDNGITVTLDGQGADELLAGYLGYPGARMHSLLERGNIIELFNFVYNWSKWPGRSYHKGWIGLGGRILPNHLLNIGWKLIGQDPVPSWLNTQYLEQHGVLMANPKTPPQKGEHKRRLAAALRESITKGLPSLMRHADRNSMFWSIESRVPFLTLPIAEFLLSLPEHYLISPQGETKYIFKVAMQGIVPDEILNRKDKIGFETPENKWLSTIWQDILKWTKYAEQIPFLNPNNVHNEISGILGGQKQYSPMAWRLINICRWAQIMGVKS